MQDWREIAGWFTDEDAHALRALLSRCPIGSLTAHVGIFCGRHLAACAEVIRARKLRCLCVDTFRGTWGVQMEAADWGSVEKAYRKTVHEYGLVKQVQTCVAPSQQAAAIANYREEPFSLVFLDADHGYEAVKEDIAAWGALLVPGGILCGHDWGDPHWPGVERAAVELLGDRAQWLAGGVWYALPVRDH
jgi:Methyltransferase domain